MPSALQIADSIHRGESVSQEDLTKLADCYATLLQRLAKPIQCHLDWAGDPCGPGVYALRNKLPGLPTGATLGQDGGEWKIRFFNSAEFLTARGATISEAEEDLLRYLGLDPRSFLPHPFVPELQEKGLVSETEWNSITGENGARTPAASFRQPDGLLASLENDKGMDDRLTADGGVSRLWYVESPVVLNGAASGGGESEFTGFYSRRAATAETVTALVEEYGVREEDIRVEALDLDAPARSGQAFVVIFDLEALPPFQIEQSMADAAALLVPFGDMEGIKIFSAELDKRFTFWTGCQPGENAAPERILTAAECIETSGTAPMLEAAAGD